MKDNFIKNKVNEEHARKKCFPCSDSQGNRRRLWPESNPLNNLFFLAAIYTQSWRSSVRY